jgi:hypothetical protein
MPRVASGGRAGDALASASTRPHSRRTSPGPSPSGQPAFRRAREQCERDGVAVDRLRACQDEHPSGTRLPSCVKLYVPDSDGQWRMIFQIGADETGLLLSYLAGGVGTSRAEREDPTRTRSLTMACTDGGRGARAAEPGRTTGCVVRQRPRIRRCRPRPSVFAAPRSGCRRARLHRAGGPGIRT